MPRLSTSVPKYQKHKPSGQAVVTLGGHDHYLGKYGTKASRMLYERLVGEWLASGRKAPPRDADALTVTQLIARYWEFAKAFYRRPDGTPTGTPTETAQNLKPALRTLRQLYGSLPADEFGPLALKVVRERFIELGQSRRYVNENVDRIKRMYRWGVSEELVDESTLRRLCTVEGLRKGKTRAPDNPRVPPVPEDIVDATLPFLPPTVSDMVQLQRLTGARPGEICILRPFDVEQSGDVWVYIPERHKTEHDGKDRAIVLGPRAQAVLAPYLDREPLSYCFSPAEVVEVHLRRRHAARVTPLSCGTKPKAQRKKGRGGAGECYTNDSYRRVIHRACDRAFPPPAPLAKREKESDAARMRRLSDEQAEELKKWQSDHRWSPNQLRHTMGTRTRELFGIEAVAAVLGHSRTDTSEIYALRNLKLAAEVARKLG